VWCVGECVVLCCGVVFLLCCYWFGVCEQFVLVVCIE